MKLHKVLQQVDLETLGIFAQRISSAGYKLEDLDEILSHKRFSNESCEENIESLDEVLDEVGKFIQRCCHTEKEYSTFTLKDVISLLDEDYNEAVEPEELKYKVSLDLSEATEKLKELKEDLQKDALSEAVDEINNIIKPFYDSIGVDHSVDIEDVRKQKVNYILREASKCDCTNKVPVLKVPFDLLYAALFEPNSEENKLLKKLSNDTDKVLNGEQSFLILPSDEGFGLEM